MGVLLLIGFLVLGAVLILGGPAAAECDPEPAFAREDVVRGMADLNVFLARHSAFADYLRRRDACSGPTGE